MAEVIRGFQSLQQTARTKAGVVKVGIAGLEQECAVQLGCTGVIFEMNLSAGENELFTYLYDEKGEAGGAYFTEVEAL